MRDEAEVSKDSVHRSVVRGGSMLVRRRGALALTLGLCACSIDDRQLEAVSAKLKGTTARVSASQCVAVGGEQLVIAYASAFVESADPDSDAANLAQAQLEVSFFDSVDCSGTRNGYFETPPSSVAGAWATIQAGGLSSATTSSVLVALVALKAATTAEASAYFDNVMLKAKTPEP